MDLNMLTPDWHCISEPKDLFELVRTEDIAALDEQVPVRDIELKPEYRSRLDNVIRDFYNPVLKQAVIYKRAVGFFSSSALLSLTAGICGLIENGGSIQMIASPRLSPEDIEAINDGIRRRDDVIKEALLRELREPKTALLALTFCNRFYWPRGASAFMQSNR